MPVSSLSESPSGTGKTACDVDGRGWGVVVGTDTVPGVSESPHVLLSLSASVGTLSGVTLAAADFLPLVSFFRRRLPRNEFLAACFRLAITPQTIYVGKTFETQRQKPGNLLKMTKTGHSLNEVHNTGSHHGVLNCTCAYKFRPIESALTNNIGLSNASYQLQANQNAC